MTQSKLQQAGFLVDQVLKILTQQNTTPQIVVKKLYQARGQIDQLIFQEYLEAQPTRVLLDWLNQARMHGSYSPFDGLHYYTAQDIKELLASREHIMSKKEAKEFRKKQAKFKKHR